MRYLIDTHIWHRAVFSAERERSPLSSSVMDILQREGMQVALCDVSVLELARHLLDAGNPEPVCMSALTHALRGIKVLAIDPQTAVRSFALEWTKKNGKPHRDPADRVIVATALTHGLALITEDGEMIHSAPRWGLSVIS